MNDEVLHVKDTVSGIGQIWASAYLRKFTLTVPVAIHDVFLAILCCLRSMGYDLPNDSYQTVNLIPSLYGETH